MILLTTASLLLVLMIIASLLLVLILGIALVGLDTRPNGKKKVIRKQTSATRKPGKPANTLPVAPKIDQPESVVRAKNDLEANQTSRTSNQKSVIRKRPLTNIDEDKYSQPRSSPPNWYVHEGIQMIIPYYPDATKGVDLRAFPGTCKVYIDRRHAWTSNITDMMSAQALWQAAQKHQGIAIEPESPCPLVTLAHDELRMANEMKEIPHSVAKRWEDRELIGKYRCLATDRQHLIEVKTYRITTFEQRQLIDTITGNSFEETVTIDSREERLIAPCPY